MNIQKYLIINIRPNPENEFQKIEFVGEISGNIVRFDPFVSCDLPWFDALKWTGKSVSFNGWKNESGCYLISELLEVL